MTRKSLRSTGVRARIAAAAARIMAEDGIDDFSLAKRKAARQIGAVQGQSLPGNDEIEAELRAYRALYQADEHRLRLSELRRTALRLMRELARFRPYLTGPVLAGTAGRYAELELQIFPASLKDVEIFLMDRRIAYTSRESRRYAGDQPHAATVLSLSWEGTPVKLSVFDPRVERLSLKSSQAGRAIDRAGASEVSALIRDADSA